MKNTEQVQTVKQMIQEGSIKKLDVVMQAQQYYQAFQTKPTTSLKRANEDDNDRVLAHHKHVAESRRKLVGETIRYIADKGADYIVVFIGGHIKREKAWVMNQRYCYVNPNLSAMDMNNNIAIKQEMEN